MIKYYLSYLNIIWYILVTIKYVVTILKKADLLIGYKNVVSEVLKLKKYYVSFLSLTIKMVLWQFPWIHAIDWIRYITQLPLLGVVSLPKL